METAAEISVDTKLHPALDVAYPSALIIACIDPRFFFSLLLFISEDLKLSYGEFVPILNPGGALYICQSGIAPHEFQHLHNTVEFSFEKFKSLRTVIVINHEECACYAEVHAQMGDRFLRGMTMEDLQIKHLSEAFRTRISTAIPRSATIRSFYMKYADPNHKLVQFNEVK